MAEASLGYSQAVVKALLTFNGGAILAILTFYGNIMTKQKGPIISAESITYLQMAMGVFATGVACALISVMLHNHAQHSFYLFQNSKVLHSAGEKLDIAAWRAGKLQRRWGIVAASASFLCFAAGVGFAVNSLKLIA